MNIVKSSFFCSVWDYYFVKFIFPLSGIRHSLISITAYYNWGDNFILRYNRLGVGVCGSWGHLLSLTNERPAWPLSWPITGRDCGRCSPSVLTYPLELSMSALSSLDSTCGLWHHQGKVKNMMKYWYFVTTFEWMLFINLIKFKLLSIFFDRHILC